MEDLFIPELLLDCTACYSKNVVSTGHENQFICRNCGQVFKVMVDKPE